MNNTNNTPCYTCGHIHTQTFGKDAVILLTEARLDASVCPRRTKYLEAQVKEFMEYLDNQGLNGREIVLAIHNSTVRILEEDIMEEFIWSSFRNKDDSAFDVMAGLDNHYTRANTEQDLQDAYWDMLEGNARKAEWKTKDDEGNELFEDAKAFLDRIEGSFNPDLPRHRRLKYNAYQILNGKKLVEEGDKKSWKKVSLSFKEKINLHRFKLKTISYEQWAYLTNWVNVLLSVEDKETGDIKQFPCSSQNINTEEQSEDIMDQEWEVIEVYNTMD